MIFNNYIKNNLENNMNENINRYEKANCHGMLGDRYWVSP